MKSKAILITGCDTGFGHHLAKYLSSHGVTVFAGCLHVDGKGAQDLKSHEPSSLHVIQLDVTSDKQIHEAVENIKQYTDNKDSLWGLVNNAGLNMVGDIELTAMQQFENQVNINQLGMVRVTKAFLPLLRKSKGRVVNVTSVKGIVAFPGSAAYAMTKFAGEAFSDILRMEMKRFGVNVSIIEPCHFGGATASLEIDRITHDFNLMWEHMTPELRATYGKEYVDYFVKDSKNAVTVSAFNVFPVIHAMGDALFSRHPKTRYLIKGGKSWLDRYWVFGKIRQFLPDSFKDNQLLSWNNDFPAPRVLQKKIL